MRKQLGAVRPKESVRAALEEPIDPSGNSEAAELARARSRMDTANDALATFEYDVALERLGQAEAMLSRLAPSAAMFSALADLHRAVGVVQAFRHDNARALAEFALAQRLDPTRTALDRAQYPPPIVKLWEQARERSPRRTSLRMLSEPPGAALFLDGRAVGTAPLVLDDVAVGEHLVSASVEARVPRSEFVRVGERGQTVTLALPPLSAEARIVALRTSLLRPGVPASEVDAASAELRALAGIDELVLVRSPTMSLPSSTAPPTPPPPVGETVRPVRKRPLLVAGAVALVAGVALLAGGIYSAARARQLSDQVSAERSAWNPALDQAVRDGRDAERNEAILFGVGGAVTVGGVVLVWLGAR
jgi:PEGA domain-containing protein